MTYKNVNFIPEMLLSIALNSGYINEMTINGFKANRKNSMLNFKGFFFIYYKFVLSMGTAEMFRV